MTHVYIAMYERYNNYKIVGVFSTEQLANECIVKTKPSHDKFTEFFVDKFTVDGKDE